MGRVLALETADWLGLIGGLVYFWLVLGVLVWLIQNWRKQRAARRAERDFMKAAVRLAGAEMPVSERLREIERHYERHSQGLQKLGRKPASLPAVLSSALYRLDVEGSEAFSKQSQAAAPERQILAELVREAEARDLARASSDEDPTADAEVRRVVEDQTAALREQQGRHTQQMRAVWATVAVTFLGSVLTAIATLLAD